MTTLSCNNRQTQQMHTIKPECVLESHGSRISWVTNNAKRAYLDGHGDVSTGNSSLIVIPLHTTKYTLTVFNGASSSSCQATVTITEPKTHVSLINIPYTGWNNFTFITFLFAIIFTSLYGMVYATQISNKQNYTK